ncbi:hypothetical protein [Sphingopyxis sp.]|uniref:hypothetical protein n=1 Tax=Sphingopyxis sp. TaxID=1908224 RepID=UPI003D6CBD10
MTLIEIASLFEARKVSVIDATGLDKDALHIYFGLAVFLAVRLVWRWRGGWVVAWLVVLAMACGGEWLDVTAELGRSAIQPDAAHWHDIWNTMFWPTVLLLFGRWLQPGVTAPVAVDGNETRASPIRETPVRSVEEARVRSGENAERRLEQA